jgi:NodT family efflux transporter outer membrane factor (OMF) lipoprotein
MNRAALILLACSALTACVGPRLEPPAAAAVNPRPAWRDGTAGVAVAIDSRWWQEFGDPVLSQIVEAALANNIDVAIAASRVEEARAQFRLARSQQLPSVNAAVGGDHDRSVNAFGQGVDQWAGKGEIQASFDLDLFGRLAKSTAAARAQLLASQASRDNVRLAVATSAANGYVTLRALDARLAVLRDTLVAQAASLKLTERRANAGYASRLDLAQAQAEYQGTAQQIPAAELAVAQQENGLNILLGREPGAVIRGKPLNAIGLPQVPVLVPSRLLERRPDVATAANQIVAADRSLDAARAAFMPDVSLSALGGAVASSLLGDPISIFSLGGSILAPLFEGGRLRAQADVASARRDQAAFGYRQVALNAFREVEDGMAAQQRDQEQEAALVARRAALANALRLADNRYRAGYSPYLDFLDVERALLSADLALVQSRADRLTNAVLLYQAVGGGWSPQSVESAR